MFIVKHLYLSRQPVTGSSPSMNGFLQQDLMTVQPGWPFKALQQMYRSPPSLHRRKSHEYQGLYKPPASKEQSQAVTMIRDKFGTYHDAP